MIKSSKSYHKNLAKYFARKSLYLNKSTWNKLNVRKLDELPWQQMKSGNFTGLEQTLVNVDIFLALSDKDRFEIWRYWQSMPAHRRHFVPKYTKAINKWRIKLGQTNRFELALNELSHFFYVSEEKDASVNLFEEVYQLAKVLYQRGDIRLAIRENNLAACYTCNQDWHKALELFESARPVYIKELGLNNADTWIVLEGIAVCLVHTKRVNEGIVELKKCLETSRKFNGDFSYATANCMSNLADAYTYTGELNKSISLLKDAHVIYKKVLDVNHPRTNDCKEKLDDWRRLSKLQAQTVNLEKELKFTKALEIYIQMEDLCAELSAKSMMANCLFGKARLLRALRYETEAISEANLALRFAEDANMKQIEPIKLFLEIKNDVIDGGLQEESGLAVNDLAEIYVKAVKDLPYPKSHQALRRLALNIFKMGDYHAAEKLLIRLLETGFEPESTYIHLARLCLLTGQITKCSNYIKKGESLKSQAKAYVLARLIWFRIALAFIKGKPVKNILGQMKTVLQNDDAIMEWTMQPVLDHIRPEITDPQYALLAALVSVMSNPGRTKELNKFDIWHDTEMQPIG